MSYKRTARPKITTQRTRLLVVVRRGCEWYGCSTKYAADAKAMLLCHSFDDIGYTWGGHIKDWVTSFWSGGHHFKFIQFCGLFSSPPILMCRFLATSPDGPVQVVGFYKCKQRGVLIIIIILIIIRGGLSYHKGFRLNSHLRVKHWHVQFKYTHANFLHKPTLLPPLPDRM